LQKDDSALIDEIRSGSNEAFDQMMQKYQEHIYHIAFGFTKDSQNALDITQNVFLKVYENLNKFRSQSQFKTWLTRIAFNESHNWWKKNQKYQKQENFNERALDMQKTISQEDEYLAHENRTLLLKNLYELNTKYRLAVVLRYFENYTIREISAVLKCSEGVVKNMLFRSLQMLKKNLKILDSGVS